MRKGGIMLGFILLCRRGLSTASWWLVTVTTGLSLDNPLIEHPGGKGHMSSSPMVTASKQSYQQDDTDRYTVMTNQSRALVDRSLAPP